MFEVGQKVRCVHNHPKLTFGKIYTVVACDEHYVRVEGVFGLGGKPGGWDHDRFEPVAEDQGFYIGGKVKCIKAENYRFLEEGREYIVEDIEDEFLSVEEATGIHYKSRFEPVEEQEKETKEMTKVIFTYSGDSATVVLDGEIHTITSGEGSYEALVEELKKESHDVEKIKGLVDKTKAVQEYTKGEVKIVGNQVFYKGEEINDSLTDKMLQLMDEGFDIGPWVAFLENLMQNPSFNSRKCLFNFLEKFQAPFTPDGCFIAFKRVDQDFKDLRTHTMDNSPGTVVKMDRADVDDNPRNTCSSGLHCAASSYLDSYANATRAKTIMLKVNPKDVVAVPADYNFAKMRVCEYEVLADITVEEMKDYETRAVVDSWEDSEEVSSDWSEGDWITYEGPDYGYMQNGKDYCIVEVDEGDNTVCVLDNDGDRFWLDYEGYDA